MTVQKKLEVLVLINKSTSQGFETWVFQLCEFVCFGNEGQLYVSATQQLAVQGSNPTLERAIQCVEESLVDALANVVHDALDDFGLTPLAGVTTRAISRELVRAFADYGAALSRQRHDGAKRLGRLPIIVTVGAILGAALERDPTTGLANGRMFLSMN